MERFVGRNVLAERRKVGRENTLETGGQVVLPPHLPQAEHTVLTAQKLDTQNTHQTSVRVHGWCSSDVSNRHLRWKMYYDIVYPDVKESENTLGLHHNDKRFPDKLTPKCKIKNKISKTVHTAYKSIFNPKYYRRHSPYFKTGVII